MVMFKLIFKNSKVIYGRRIGKSGKQQTGLGARP